MSEQDQTRTTDRRMSPEALREVGFDAEGNVTHAYEVRGEQRGGRGAATVTAFLNAGKRQ